MDNTMTDGKRSECLDSPALEEKHTKLYHDFYGLQAKFTAALNCLRAGNGTIEQITKDMAAMESNINGLEDYVRFCLHPKYYNEIRRREDSSIAERVFNIPELLEHILLNASVDSIIAMQRTNRNIRSMIAASSKLQVELCLKPEVKDINAQTRYRSPFARYGSHIDTFVVSIRHRLFEAKFTREADGSAPKIKVHTARMLICQPPIRHVHFYRLCADCKLPDASSVGEISSAKGLTVGDLFARSKVFFSSSYSCLDCSQKGGGLVVPMPKTETREVVFSHDITAEET